MFFLVYLYIIKFEWVIVVGIYDVVVIGVLIGVVWGVKGGIVVMLYDYLDFVNKFVY